MDALGGLSTRDILTAIRNATVSCVQYQSSSILSAPVFLRFSTSD